VGFSTRRRGQRFRIQRSSEEEEAYGEVERMGEEVERCEVCWIE
jgi:hypothetical protein